VAKRGFCIQQTGIILIFILFLFLFLFLPSVARKTKEKNG